MMFKIIIVEDDKELREELKILLDNAGYEAVIIEDLYGKVEEKILNENPNLLLLDVNLPNKNGYEICSKVRKRSEGGDDYIEKPYNVPVLLARISAILKRTSQKESEPSTIQYKGIKLNTLNGIVTYNEKQIELPRTEFKILYYLFKNTEKIIPRVDIIEYMWDNKMYVDDNTLSVNITRIREKLAEIGVYNLIETKRGQGYKL